jgi:hypothetical protein
MLRAVLIVLAGALFAREADACATCGCGDMTLTTMGSEKPYAGRLRAALEMRHRSDAVGQEGFNRQSLSEQRFDAQLIWAPKTWLILMADVPALLRTVSYVNLAQREQSGLGEIELRAKWFVYQNDPFVPSHLLALTGGVKLPTAQFDRDANGQPLPIELQAGTGSVDPMAGLAYSYFSGDWSIYASATGTLTTWGRERYRAPRSLRTTTAVQYQITRNFAGRLGIDTRTDSTAREEGSVAADTGGFIGFATAEALFAPGFPSDWLLYAGVRVPVVNALTGHHDEGVFLNAGVAYDFF